VLVVGNKNLIAISLYGYIMQWLTGYRVVQMKKRTFASLVFFLLLQTACSTQIPIDAAKAAGDGMGMNKEAALQAASEEFNRANTAVKLKRSILAYNHVLSMDAQNVTALTALSSQYILLGTAYTESTSRKREMFGRAKLYAEKAMLTNPEFRKKREAGAEVWEAADTVREPEAEAALLWVTAWQYEFKEVMNTVERVFNANTLLNTVPMLQQIEKLSPNYAGGAVDFALAINYLAIPDLLGGDSELGMRYLTKVFNNNRDWMFGRWAMGIYYADLAGFTNEVYYSLTYVASANIEEYKDPYPWKVHFQRSADEKLRSF
jgi:hypothetical protein